MKPSTPPLRRGFSLVELLAAMSILTLLAVIIAQITSAITHTTSLSYRAIDAASQARLAFDRLAMDLEGLVKRADIDFLAQNPAAASGTDCLLQFLATVPSAATSSSNNRGISVVSYEVAPHADQQSRTCLLRSGKAIGWNSAAGTPSAGIIGLQNDGLPLAFTAAGFAPFQAAQTDFDVLAEGVIRMVIGFQLYPDNQPFRLADATTGTARGQIVYSPPLRTLTSPTSGASADYIDTARIGALVVGIAALDTRTLRMLNASQTAALANAFPLPSAPASPLQAWSKLAERAAGDAALSAVPVAARQAVRVFERYYPITPFPAHNP